MRVFSLAFPFPRLLFIYSFYINNTKYHVGHNFKVISENGKC
jgi:hypothetical protein